MSPNENTSERGSKVALDTASGFASEPTIESGSDDWSESRGLIKAAVWTFLAAAIAAALMWPVCAVAPTILFHWMIRSATAFLLAWVLFGIAQNAASFVGWPVSAIAIGGTLLALFSNHVVVSIYGYPSINGTLGGWLWCDVPVLLILNIPSFVAIAFCTALRHDGDGDASTLLDIFARRL